MDYQLTENQLQVQVLLQIVYMPMFALKVVKYPINKIISQHLLASQFSIDEQKHTENGIKALVELGIFAQEGNDICITNRSEAILEGLDNFSRGTEEQVKNSLKGSPKFKELLDAIERDSRLRPYSSATLTPTINTTPINVSQTLESKPMSIGDKFAIAFLFIGVILGLTKIMGLH